MHGLYVVLEPARSIQAHLFGAFGVMKQTCTYVV